MLFRSGRYDEALAHLRAAAAQYPRDRVVVNQIGRVLFLKRQYPEAIAELKKVLAIDPEDRTAHYHRMLLYRAKADEATDEAGKAALSQAAAEAEKALAKYEIDESAQKWTNEFRRARPEINLESQMVHVHPLGVVK